jgi:hypothetical protein
MLVVIMTGSVMFGLCIGMIHVLLRIDRAGKAQVAERAARSRLGREFRADVHAAERAEPASGRTHRLLLVLPGERTVEYRFEPRRILRVCSQSGELKNQDAFVLPRGSAADVELESRAGRTFVVLSVEPHDKSEPGAVTLREYQIDAALGIDHRFDAGKDR